MADYGTVGSTHRKLWWTSFVNPLGHLCAATPGVDRLGIKYSSWMAYKPVPHSIPVRLRNRTKDLCSYYDVKWMSGTLGNLSGATKLLGELQAASGSSGGALAGVAGTVVAAEILPEYEDDYDLGGYDLEDVSNQFLDTVDTGGTPEQSGMPGWAKVTLGVTGGLVVFGGGLLAVMSMSKK
ncbi:MAG TPA: hypothetical protein EYF98_04445 [Planctomycetes bacterium]|nr:hypothetical protein [Planctomycetota bacterium]